MPTATSNHTSDRSGAALRRSGSLRSPSEGAVAKAKAASSFPNSIWKRTCPAKFHFAPSLFIIFLSLLPASAQDLQPSNLFSDGGVLQQGQPVPVWGEAAPGAAITVSFQGRKATGTADRFGHWQVALPALKANAKPEDLVIQSTANGKTDEKRIKDELVGEVWLCSGQSNMALALAETDGAAEEMKKSDPLLRMFRVPERPGEKPWTTVNGNWTDFSPATANRWSAMPYYFGKGLRQGLDVPVGILMCAWGGSSAEAWMSPEALHTPQLRPLIPDNVIGFRPNIAPSYLFNGMLSPLIPYAIAGAAWYQGETDGEPYMNAYYYRFLMPGLINDWRHQWSNPDLPFYLVQLPTLINKPAWAVVREGQAIAAALPHAGMITTLDIGQDTKLHPTNKADFGQRFANLVLGKNYGKPTWPGGPEFSTLKPEGASIRVVFKNTGKGLKTTDGQPPLAFTVAEKNGDFKPAAAKIENDSVVLHADGVAAPDAVRYAFDANPKVNLTNDSGLPTAPFRTDTRLVSGQEMAWQDLPKKPALAVSANGADLTANKNPNFVLTREGIEDVLFDKMRYLRVTGPITQIAVTNTTLRKGMTLDSPLIYWSATPDVVKTLDPAKGLTVETAVQIFVGNDPSRGFDLDAVLPQADGKLRRYLVAIQPMRVSAFRDKEIHLLGTNLDNLTSVCTYRLAIRPDGMAQVYLDGEPIGIFDGQLLDHDKTITQPCLKVGKEAAGNEMTTTVKSISLDPTGAYAP